MALYKERDNGEIIAEIIVILLVIIYLLTL